MTVDAQNPGRDRRTGHDRGRRGSAIVEFAVALPFLLVLLLATVDFGNFIQARLIITSVSREGGSIGSRQDPIDPGLGDLLVESGRPLDLAGPAAKVIITRVAAAANADQPAPTIATRIERGSLGVSGTISAGKTDFGLTSALYNHLVFDAGQGSADIAGMTVVEVYYKYRPITPLYNFIPGLLVVDGGGVIISSRSFF